MNGNCKRKGKQKTELAIVIDNEVALINIIQMIRGKLIIECEVRLQENQRHFNLIKMQVSYF